jgi:hypothetical protein
VIHYGAELKVHADRRGQTADVLCANYSTTLSAKSPAKCVSVVKACDKGNLMGIPLAGVKYIYVYGDSSKTTAVQRRANYITHLYLITYKTVSRSSD